MWSKGNPSALLEGMQASAVTMENSRELLQKSKNGRVPAKMEAFIETLHFLAQPKGR